MKTRYLFLLFTLGLILPVLAQDQAFSTDLYDSYEQFKEPSLNQRRIKHQDLQPLIESLQGNDLFEVNRVGTSIEGRSLSLISLGKGKIDVLLWSQMHGDEPTATQAIFDLINFFKSDTYKKEKKQLLKKLRIHFLPMLNPDGAQLYTRRNALGIDLNRDALRLQAPESQTLKRVRDSLNADVGFNLHDQSVYYNAERTNKPATISYLATAYNYEKEINDTRARSMRVISFMNRIIQKYAPGQVGRYNDDFEPRAFGDNIQKWGTSLILIESGGYQNDIEKQQIRKLNYVSILAALMTLADKSYQKIEISEYEKIPMNDRKLFDLKLKNVTYLLRDKPYRVDLGIQRFEVDNVLHDQFYNRSQIVDIGDLSTFYGYEEFEGTDYTIVPGKLYVPKVLTKEPPSGEEALTLLKQGYLYYQLAESMPINEVSVPMQMVTKNFSIPLFNLYIGLNPSFFLEKEGELRFAVVNGFLIDLSNGEGHFNNALFLK